MGTLVGLWTTRDSGKGSVRGSPAVSGEARRQELGWLPEGPGSED